MLAWKLRAAGEAVPLSLSFFDSANSVSSATVTWPSGILAGDHAFLFDLATQANTLPTEVVPSGFTKLTGATKSTGAPIEQLGRGTVSYKECAGGESGNITGQIGTSSNRKVLLVFRGSSPATGVSFSTPTIEATSSAPSNQSIAASGQPTPILLLACFSGNGVVTPASVSPAFDAEIAASNNHMRIRYKIYNNGSPSSHTFGQNDVGTVNFLSGFYFLPTT